MIVFIPADPFLVNDYILDPSWTSQPYPGAFLPGGIWPPRHIDDIICTTSPKYIPCVGPTCYNNKSNPCRSPSCTHTLSAWKTATSDWEKYIELRATPDRGIGTYTKRAFRAGTILGWYAGAVKPTDAIPYGTNDYLMDMEIGDIDLDTPAESAYMGSIDAETTGNWTRFINHSCAADCVFSLKRVGKTRIMVVQAVKNIPSGKELSVDYGSSYYGLDSSKRCGCGAPECVEKKRRRLESARKRKQV